MATPANIFGRGQATVQSPGCDHTVKIGDPSSASRSLFVLDGVTVQTVASNRLGPVGVYIFGGSSRLQSCVVTGPSFNSILCRDPGGASRFPPVIIHCRYLYIHMISVSHDWQTSSLYQTPTHPVG